MQGDPKSFQSGGALAPNERQISDRDKGLAGMAVIAALLAGLGIDVGIWTVVAPSAVTTALCGGLFAARHIFPHRRACLGII